MVNGSIGVPVSKDAPQELVLRIATSFVSLEQASTNLEREASQGFDALLAESQAEWRRTLSAITVNEVGNGYSTAEKEGLLEVFYTSLYRAVQFPRLMHEITSDGREVHFSPYDIKDRVLPGAVSTDSGFWDAYRTVYPLLAVVFPEQYGRLVDGWLTAWQEGGWLPNWASPGYRSSMWGSMGDVVLSEALVKGIPGINRTAAYLAIRQDAFREASAEAMAGRLELNDYERLGYVPSDSQLGETVSRSLGYMVADHAISKAAKVMGHDQDAKVLHERAQRYDLLFDKLSGFFRPKGRNGHFTGAFDEYSWGGEYTEGGPWQYRFAVPHDPVGLASLYRSSGRDICEELEVMNAGPNTIDMLPGSTVMHEMGEMKRNCWGQYAHNNQPVHDAQYMYLAVGKTPDANCSRRGQHWIRKALLELYKPGASMYPGDEDNGEMGAWFVLSALGLYQLEPAGSSYVLGSPLFADVTVRLRQGELRILAENHSRARPFVQEVRLNNRKLSELSVPYASLMQGGELRFEMAPETDRGLKDFQPPRRSAPKRASTKKRRSSGFLRV
jgi:predicted alpha-1,2-mannosidase